MSVQTMSNPTHEGGGRMFVSILLGCEPETGPAKAKAPAAQPWHPVRSVVVAVSTLDRCKSAPPDSIFLYTLQLILRCWVHKGEVGKQRGRNLQMQP